MSGYSICNKLKKDNDLKGIPLIITSKEATPETFAQHKKLKTRAEDYLIKPFQEAELIEKIGALIPLPAGGAAAAPADDFAAIDSLGSDDLSLDSLGDLGDAPAAPANNLNAEDEAVLAGLDDLGMSKEDEPLSLDSLDLGAP